MEAVCFQTCDVLEAMKLDAQFDDLKALKVDGGASRNATLMQIQVSPRRTASNCASCDRQGGFAADGRRQTAESRSDVAWRRLSRRNRRRILQRGRNGQ